MTISNNETLVDYINQNGVRPGPRKLAQFKQALALRNTPKLYSQDGKGDEAIVYVKIFDPCGSWTWYITEWDDGDEAYGLVNGFEMEYGYISISYLSTIKGALGIGLEIDVHFKPTTLGEVKKKHA
jgi:Protein of unknown function (DUF2958)